MKKVKTISRRNLLRNTLAATGITSLALPSFLSGENQSQARIRFGVRGPLPKINLRERVLLLKQLGFDGIELGPEFLDRPAAGILSDLKGTGIAVSAIVGSLELLNPDPKERAKAIQFDLERIQMAHELGASALIEVPVFGPCRFPNPPVPPALHQEEDRLLVEGIRQLEPALRKNNLMLLLEPLTRKETHYMNRQEHGAQIIQVSKATQVRLLSDFYHMQMEEPDLAATLRKYGQFTGYVHLAETAARTEPGSHGFDYRPGFRALKQQGFKGWLVIESGASDNPEGALRRGLKYIRQQWEEA
jgi:sugar phosphate isomerase/epimerase